MKIATHRNLWFSCLFLVVLSSEAKKKDRQRDDNANGSSTGPLKVKTNDRNPQRQDLFEGLDDPEGSAQGISQAAINPYLLQNGQGGFQNQLFQGGAGGLGVGGFSGLQSAYAGQNFFQNPYLGSAGGFNNLQQFGGAGLSGLQNPYLLQQQQGLQGLQGIQGLQGGINPYSDIYSQQANLYNPYLGGNAGAGGLNPLLLASARNQQYLAGGVNPYLSQGLLSPYSNYNQINPYSSYPLASRFGIGVGRTNSRGQSSSSSNTSDE